MNKKIIITLNILAVILIIGGFIYWKMQKNAPEVQPSDTNYPTFPVSQKNNGSTPKPAAAKPDETSTSTAPKKAESPENIKVTTMEGETLSMKNFYLSPYTRIIDKDNDAVVKEGVNYSFMFYAKYQSFYISLEGGDLYITREEAEQAFLDKLEITKEDACKLYVALTVPFTVSEKAAGTDYHLSFCPNGIPLPKNLND
ncbi:MAG: hypothetical protein WCT49_00150 [Candidatus Paceibacterota bacterium]|jgi:hypothetical protein|nr:hypothetical protein [Candidatus Paceibacterota bacterium]